MRSAPTPYQVCRRARVARDARYDGLIFSGSTTTRVYCRPICPGKPPRPSNNVYFHDRAQAEAAGFRPCLRCRPELAPANFIQNADGSEVRAVLAQIHQGKLPDEVRDAHPVPVKGPSGHMDSGFQAAVGVTLSEYWQTFRSGFAKILLTDTALSMADIAAAAGFESTQQMLEALTALYGRDPLGFRKPLPVQPSPGLKSCALMLAYRPPFDGPALLNYFRSRAITGVEKVADGVYQRSFCLNGHTGWISLQDTPDLHAVRLEVHASDPRCLMQVSWRVRRMLDLDADPLVLQSTFREDAVLGPVWRRHSGVRVPVCWDPFEFAVRAIVGQLISVSHATTLMGRIVDAFSEHLRHPAPKGIGKVFPGPTRLRSADVKPCGTTRIKAEAIAALARAVDEGALNLEMTTDLNTFTKQCTSFRGIGDWTAQTIAMRGLGDPDAFPSGDLGIVKALSMDGRPLKPASIRSMAEQWRPWRAYAAMLLWMM